MKMKNTFNFEMFLVGVQLLTNTRYLLAILSTWNRSHIMFQVDKFAKYVKFPDTEDRHI